VAEQRISDLDLRALASGEHHASPAAWEDDR
jgi:hypothetical protein